MEVNACIDIPRDSDYKFDEVFGSSDLPTFVLYNRTSIYNQGAIHTPSTAYACTCYWATHCVNEGNALEAIEHWVTLEKEVNPTVIWWQALLRWADVKKGWSLQGAIKLMMDLGCISGYTKCWNISEVKQALALGQQIFTGSSKIDWLETRKDNIVVKGDSFWHAFKIDWYDDDQQWLILRNSYWTWVYDKGRFYLRYKDFPILFSCYAFADSASKEIREAQSVKRRALAKSLGYYNWEENDTLLSRQNAVYMAMAVCGVKDDTGFWNKKFWTKPVIKRDYATMLSKSGKKIPFVFNGDETITRGEAAEWTVRLEWI